MSRVIVKKQNKHAMQRLEERAGLTQKEVFNSASKKGLDPEYFKDSYYELYDYLRNINPRKRVKLYKGFVYIFNKTSNGCITMYPLKERFKERYEFILKEEKEISELEIPALEDYPIATVTGHRLGRLGCTMKYNEPYLEECADLLDWFKAKFYTDNIKEVYCGLANGTDMAAAMAVIMLKEEGVDIKLNCVLPFTDYNTNDYYMQYVIDHCDNFKKIYNYTYYEACSDRNFYMVNRSNVVYAVFDGEDNGGTSNTLYYANEYNINVNYYPQELIKRNGVIKAYYENQYTDSEEDIEL